MPYGILENETKQIKRRNIVRDITELAKDEIEELVKDYQRPSSEITVAQIIEKYALNIKPNKIAANLPE